MENHHEESVLREIPDLDTLHELLARLNEVETYEPVSRTDKITVEDIAEALHLDPDYVAQELEDILAEHRSARLSEALRELEEPLYRVERTGHTPHDPLGNPLYKLRSVQLLAERSKVQPSLPRRQFQETKSDKFGQLIGRLMIIVMIILFAAITIKAVITMSMQK
jgi:hypothetical protein